MYKFFFHLHLHQTKTNLIMKIVDLKLEANNLNTIVDFYQNVLGFTLNNKTDNTVSFQAGNTNLTFTKNQASTAQYHFAFNIATNHLQQAIAWANSMNLELLKSPQEEIITKFDSWHSESIYFWDYNNNLLEFIAREDIQIVKETIFVPAEIINISEIGLVTQQPLATAKAINQQTNLEFFSKATPLPEFCAVGDDEGLIILVAPTRTWYPTTILATNSPAEIKIEVNEKIYTIQSTDWK